MFPDLVDPPAWVTPLRDRIVLNRHHTGRALALETPHDGIDQARGWLAEFGHRNRLNGLIDQRVRGVGRAILVQWRLP